MNLIILRNYIQRYLLDYNDYDSFAIQKIYATVYFSYFKKSIFGDPKLCCNWSLTIDKNTKCYNRIKLNKCALQDRNDV